MDDVLELRESSAPRKTPSFAGHLLKHGLELERQALTTLQINLGKLCNLACLHCHVEAGPSKKRENMGELAAQRLIELASQSKSLTTVDLTGGAPELNPQFRQLVRSFRQLGLKVIDRCNLTVLFQSGQEDCAQFLADQQVHIIASLPCYSRENLEKQRGDGVFAESIAALRALNQLGYGDPSTGLVLDLVYNPIGPKLPPSQSELEQSYRENLLEDFGIHFNQLFTITNMPIKRFLFDLKRSKQLDRYMELLVQSFNPLAVENLMCRSLLSVSWDGRLFDCDFNQALNIPIPTPAQTIWDIDSFDSFHVGKIATASHCYGCTAGAGSSCNGSVVG